MATPNSKVKKGFSFSTDAVVENKLKFKPRLAEYNLCRGYLASVEVEMKKVETVKEDGTENTSEYAGHTVPNLVFKFKQVPTAEDPSDRWFEKRFNITSTKSKDGLPIDATVVKNILTNQMHQIIHILNTFKKVKGITIPKKDFNIDPFAPTAERIEDFTTFYQFVVESLTGADESVPAYSTIQLWVKLVADYKSEKYLDFPVFVGTGFMEVYQKGIAPAIEISPKETVVLKAGKAAGKKSGAAAEADDEVDPEVAKLIAMHNS